VAFVSRRATEKKKGPEALRIASGPFCRYTEGVPAKKA
jgi:hypothetical protein